MRSPRKPLAIVGAVLAAAIVVLAAVPFLFRDRLAARLKAAVDASSDARVTWSGVDVGLLRSFPNISLSVSDLSVAGVRAFARDTLVSTRRATLVLNLGSVIGYLVSGKPIV